MMFINVYFCFQNYSFVLLFRTLKCFYDRLRPTPPELLFNFPVKTNIPSPFEISFVSYLLFPILLKESKNGRIFYFSFYCGALKFSQPNCDQWYLKGTYFCRNKFWQEPIFAGIYFRDPQFRLFCENLC